MLLEQSETSHRNVKALAAEVQAVLDQDGVSGEMRQIKEIFDAVGPKCARQSLYADLAVMGQPAGHDQEPLLANILDAVLFNSSMSILLHPNGAMPVSGEGVGATLADWSADAVIMGAYGHSRLREVILGGVTRDMLNRTTIPLLMSH